MTHDTTGFDIEAAVGLSFADQVPARSRDLIDRRVEVAIASEVARRKSRVRGRGLPGPARRLLVGVAIAVLLTGTVAAGGSLFIRMIEGAPLLEYVWDRSTEIGQSATDAGYTIVLERAAADPERVWVAVSVAAAPGTGTDLGRMRVVDVNGVVMDGGIGVGTGEVRGVSATLFGFKVPDGILPHGPFTLEVTSVISAAGETRGDWTFTFDVPLGPAWSRGPAEATAGPQTP